MRRPPAGLYLAGQVAVMLLSCMVFLAAAPWTPWGYLALVPLGISIWVLTGPWVKSRQWRELLINEKGQVAERITAPPA